MCSGPTGLTCAGLTELTCAVGRAVLTCAVRQGWPSAAVDPLQGVSPEVRARLQELGQMGFPLDRLRRLHQQFKGDEKQVLVMADPGSAGSRSAQTRQLTRQYLAWTATATAFCCFLSFRMLPLCPYK